MSSYPNLTVATLQTISHKHRPWLVMFEAGWSVKKIAAAWNETPETVEAALDTESQQPLPLPRSLPPLPQSGEECNEWRGHLRELAAHGWSLEALDRIIGGIYSPEFLAELTGQAKPTRKSRSKLDPRRLCPCRCGKRLAGRQQYSTDACRKKVARKRERSFV